MPGATAVGVVVDAPMPADAPGAQVVGVELGKAALEGTAGDRLGQRPGKQRREERDDVDPEAHRVGGMVVGRHAGGFGRARFRGGDRLLRSGAALQTRPVPA